MNKQYIIYVDLDNVLVDFYTGVEKFTGVRVNFSTQSDKFRTELIQRVGEEGGKQFWIDLNWMPDGKMLWKQINHIACLYNFEVNILSSPGANRGHLFVQNAKKGKSVWVKREIGSDVKVILESKKQKYAHEKAILIDDFIINTENFLKAGGNAILHKPGQTLNTIEQLNIAVTKLLKDK